MGRRVLGLSPIALIGGVLAIVSCFFAWDHVARVAYDDSFKVPLEFLWDKNASGGFKLGVPLVCVAGVVTLFSLSPSAPVVFLRRVGGLALLGAVALFVVQLGRRIGWDDLGVGLGPYLAGAGGLLALLAPSAGLSWTRRVR
jgi:hypothetical protein